MRHLRRLLITIALALALTTGLSVGTAQAWLVETCAVADFQVHHDYSPSTGGYFYMTRPAVSACDGMPGMWWVKARTRLRAADNSYIGAWDHPDVNSWPYTYVGGSGPLGHDPDHVNLTPQTIFNHSVVGNTGKAWLIDTEIYIESTNNVYMFHATHVFQSFGLVVNADTDSF